MPLQRSPDQELVEVACDCQWHFSFFSAEPGASRLGPSSFESPDVAGSGVVTKHVVGYLLPRLRGLPVLSTVETVAALNLKKINI